MRAGTTVGDHAVAPAGWLTGAQAKKTEAEDVRAGTTIDQIVAKQIGQDAVLPSLELATEDFTGYIGGCTPAFSCAYMNTITWASPTTPLPMEINPRLVFERLFGRAGTHAQRLARMQEDRSILDAVVGDLNDLQRTLGARDRAKVNDYMDDVREIERRIQRTEAKNRTEVRTPDAPIGIPDAFGDHVALMFDSARRGLPVRHHACLHLHDVARGQPAHFRPVGPDRAVAHLVPSRAQAGEARAERAHQPVQRGLFANFAQKLAATADGDGTLLDHSLVFYGSGMSDGDNARHGPAAAGRGRRRRWSGPPAPRSGPSDEHRQPVDERREEVR
jgi:hypothetical protein